MAGRIRYWMWTIGLIIGCGKAFPPGSPVNTTAGVIDLARNRPVADPVRVRFNIKLKSEKLDLAGSTGGALIADRPGRGHFAILGPLGSPLVKAQSDDLGLALWFTQDKRHLVALDAQSVVAEATGGVASLDDFLALLVGDLPLDGATITNQRKVENGVEFRLSGPESTQVVAVLEPIHGTPRSIRAVNKQGDVLLSATYESFEVISDGRPMMPTRTTLTVPSLDLQIDLKFKIWKELDEAPSDAIFSLDPPAGVQPESLEHAVRVLGQRLLAE